MASTAFALPDELQHLAGRIIDVDSHEMMEHREWVPTFGPDVQLLVDEWADNGHTAATDKNHPVVPGYSGDNVPITADVVNLKGCDAPGAFLPSRRLEVMDAMGVQRQMMFPGGVGLYGTMLLMRAHDPTVFPTIQGDRISIGRRWLRLYQDFLVDFAGCSDRIRPVAPVIADTVEELFTTTRRVVERGIRSIQVPAGLPLGGVSPAHSALDPFYDLLEDTNSSLTLHIGGDGKFFETLAWRDAEPFDGFRALGEFSTDPWSMAVLHMPFENFLAAMVTGGVFVRHPKLRVGVMEVGAHWVGPLMRNLDLWHTNLGHMNKNSHRLIELPSHYIARNVRVTPFPFEPIDSYIVDEGLEDIVCFSTDYPHVEGGKSAAMQMHKRIKHLGPEITEKFFVTNGAWLLPE